MTQGLATVEGQQTRLLAAVGLTDAEERMYTTLIDSGGGTAADVAAQLHIPSSRARSLLASLARKGLVTRTPDKPSRYIPAPPDVAVESLIAQREEELELVRKAATELSNKASRAVQDAETEPAEIITGAETVAAHLNRFVREAQDEVLALVRRPLKVDDVVCNDAGRDAAGRGVSVRVVYDRAMFTEQDSLEAVDPDLVAGDHLRVHAPIPATMIVVDHAVGLVPIDSCDADAGWIVLRAPHVLDLFADLFNSVWSRAALLGTSADGYDEYGEDFPEQQELLLIELLAVGLRDDAVAGHLDVSKRTIDRRVRALMARLGAQTRFQAGWLAAQRGREGSRTLRPRGSTPGRGAPRVRTG